MTSYESEMISSHWKNFKHSGIIYLNTFIRKMFSMWVDRNILQYFDLNHLILLYLVRRYELNNIETFLFNLIPFLKITFQSRRVLKK